MSGQTSAPEGLDGAGLNVAIVWARFNEDVTRQLLRAARETLERLHVDGIWEYDVPGAFELPLACSLLLQPPEDIAAEVAEGIGRGFVSRRRPMTGVDAVVALGCVIRGETPHFDFVAGECARGLMDIQLATRVPIAFGVLTTETREQALARAGGFHGNKGEDVARAAVEMAVLRKDLEETWDR